MKKSIKILLSLIAILLIAYLVFMNLPKATVKNKAAEFQITAQDLYSEFEASEKNANKKYINKVIEVSGRYLTQNIDQQGATVVILDGGGALGGVLCTLEKGEEKKIKNLEEGSQLKIKGMCTGILMDVVLIKCTVL